MIPIRLELSNFLSYRQTAVLDFNNIHVACISGLNGSGKSSLLDGMTWALFGKSRSRSDDDVVNSIAVRDGDEAKVTFDFMLGETVYRIIRRKKARKTMKLELQIGLGDGGWRTLSETKRRETEAAIVKILGMNYDTFTNASFFLQGSADKFTTETPLNRKKILADLLGVTQWDVYKGRAAEQRKAVEGELLMLEGQLGDIALELKEEEERQTAVAAAQSAQTLIHDRLEDKEALLKQARLNKTAVDQQTKQLAATRAALTKARARLQKLLADVERRQEERDGCSALLADGEAIEAAFAAWKKAEKTAVTQQKLADAFHRLDKEQHAHTVTIAREKSRLMEKRKTLRAAKKEAETAVGRRQTVAPALVAVKTTLTEIVNVIAQLEKDEAARHAAKTALQEAEAGRQLVRQEARQLEKEAARMGRLAKDRETVLGEQKAAAAALAKAEREGEETAVWKERLAAVEAESGSLEAEQPRLKEEMDKIKERMDKLEAESGSSCPLCDQALSPAHRHTVLAELGVDGKERGDRFRQNKARQAVLKKERAALKRKIKAGEAAAKQIPIAQARAAKAAARLEEIGVALAAWQAADGAVKLADLGAALADKREVLALQVEVDRLKTAVGAKRKKEQERRQHEQEIVRMETDLTALAQQIEKWEREGVPSLAAVEMTLGQEQYGEAARAALDALNKQIDALGYDSAAHEAAKEAAAGLAGAAARHALLKEAWAAVKPLDESLADAREQIGEREEAIQMLVAEEAAAVELLAEMGSAAADLERVETAVHALREEHIQAVRRTGAAQQRLDVLDDQRVRQEGLLAEKTALLERVRHLKLLEKAFGRDGVQALLIEYALPEIEEQANILLGKLTNDEMSVYFETQRELKSREGVAETLDIRLRDGKGERPYANFSGGEQFRVNFAIRLALSQLLVRRAGVNLRTLVIDEGFGSQDPNGRQRLIEAIHAVQDTFALILVITHVDALRDAFPTRIEVEKGAEGSRFIVR